MDIKIKEITKELNGRKTVVGETEIGGFLGTWMARDIEPELGKTYSCELLLPDLRAEDMTILSNDKNTPVYTEIDLNRNVVFKGLIEASESGGIVVSFSPNWIECFEISGSGINVYDSVKFVLSKEQIEIYAYEVIREEDSQE